MRPNECPNPSRVVRNNFVIQFLGCSNITTKITTASNINDGQFYKVREITIGKLCDVRTSYNC